MPYRLAPEATTLCLPVKLLLILFPLPEVQEKKKIQRNTNTNQQLQVYMKNIHLWITFTLYKQINYRQLSNLPRIIWSKSCYFCAGKKYTVKCHHECNRNAKNVLITCPCDHIAHIYCSLKGTCVEETWSFHASSTVYISVRAPAGM